VHKYGRLDDNQKEIVQSLRKLGFSVQSLACIGNGCFDLLIGAHGHNLVVEVKDGNKTPSQRKLTEDEVKWQANWCGQCAVCNSLDEVLLTISKYFTDKIVKGMV